MALSYVSGSSANTAGATSIGPTAPASTQADDILLAQVSHAANESVTAPDGTWTLVKEQGNASGHNISLFRKTLSGAASGTYTFSWTTSSAGSCILAAYRGEDTTTPEDVAAASNADSNTPYAIPSITTVTDHAFLIAGLGIVSATTAITTPATYTERVAVTANARTTLADLDKATAGAAAAADFTTAANKVGDVYQWALRPATGGGGSTWAPLTRMGLCGVGS